MLNTVKDLCALLYIDDVPMTPSTAVDPEAAATQTQDKKEPTRVVAVNGSDSETDIDNDVSDTETVVDPASTPSSPSAKSGSFTKEFAPPSPVSPSSSDADSSTDSPTREFRSLVSFFHTSPRLRRCKTPDYTKTISKTLKLGQYSPFKSLRKSPITRQGSDSSDSSDTESSDNSTPIFRRTLGPVFVASDAETPKRKMRAPKRKPIPTWGL